MNNNNNTEYYYRYTLYLDSNTYFTEVIQSNSESDAMKYINCKEQCLRELNLGKKVDSEYSILNIKKIDSEIVESLISILKEISINRTKMVELLRNIIFF